MYIEDILVNRDCWKFPRNKPPNFPGSKLFAGSQGRDRVYPGGRCGKVENIVERRERASNDRIVLPDLASVTLVRLVT